MQPYHKCSGYLFSYAWFIISKMYVVSTQLLYWTNGNLPHHYYATVAVSSGFNSKHTYIYCIEQLKLNEVI